MRPPALRGWEALKLHATLVASLAFCVLAFWFELRRAEGGNELSWAYVFEWPLLGGFAIYMWRKFLHPGEKSTKQRKSSEKVAPEYAGMLAAWQEEQRKLDLARQSEATTASSSDGAVDAEPAADK